jgi:hypothetical protein
VLRVQNPSYTDTAFGTLLSPSTLSLFFSSLEMHISAHWCPSLALFMEINAIDDDWVLLCLQWQQETRTGGDCATLFMLPPFPPPFQLGCF